MKVYSAVDVTPKKGWKLRVAERLEWIRTSPYAFKVWWLYQLWAGLTMCVLIACLFFYISYESISNKYLYLFLGGFTLFGCRKIVLMLYHYYKGKRLGFDIYDGETLEKFVKSLRNK